MDKSAAERGQARFEYYRVGSLEPFGLNKRTRRIARGDRNVTYPNGKIIEHTKIE